MLKVETIIAQPEKSKILVVSWYDYDPFMKLNFEMYFFNIIELINRENITKLVLDCSCRRHDPIAGDFKEIYELFLSGLSTTQLDKMARVCPPDPISAFKYNRLLEELIAELDLCFEFQNFKNAESAFAWVKGRSQVPDLNLIRSGKSL